MSQDSLCQHSINVKYILLLLCTTFYDKVKINADENTNALNREHLSFFSRQETN
jgi:hypothetical protein